MIGALAVAGCGGGGDEQVDPAADANLLPEATVEAILGANIPPEELAIANEFDANSIDANAGVENGSGMETIERDEP